MTVVDRETEGRQYVAISVPIGPMSRLDMPLILQRAGNMVLEALFAVDGDLWLVAPCPRTRSTRPVSTTSFGSSPP